MASHAWLFISWRASFSTMCTKPSISPYPPLLLNLFLVLLMWRHSSRTVTSFCHIFFPPFGFICVLLTEKKVKRKMEIFSSILVPFSADIVAWAVWPIFMRTRKTGGKVITYKSRDESFLWIRIWDLGWFWAENCPT